jgi:two-component system chemotaxis sensor kinase CheA
MNPFAEQFVIEARELIEQATDDLIALEREGVSSDRVDRLFRAFHTLKGSAGIVELPAMVATLHAAEDLLAATRSGSVNAVGDVAEASLACLDQLSRWVNEYESTGSLAADAGGRADALAGRLRHVQSPASAGPQQAAGAGPAPPLDWVAELIETMAPRTDAELPAEIQAIRYEPRAGCFFDGEDPLALIRQVPHLLALRVEAREPWPPLADLDPFACNLRLLALAGGSDADVASIFRLVKDEVQFVPVPRESLRRDRDRERGSLDLARSVLEEQKRVLPSTGAGEDFAGRVGAVARVAVNALCHIGREDLVPSLEAARAEGLSGENAAPLSSALDQAIAALVGPPEDIATEREIAAGVPGVEPRHEIAGSRTLRVEEGRIDALVNLAGELIVRKNALAHVAAQLEQAERRDLARALREECEGLERLVGEMHAAILALRMVPIAHAFRSFPVLVRDLARRLGKKVEFRALGAATEVDKSVVDHLFEPLVHLVRNAVDHGIERPSDRLARGKPEAATLTLQASRVANRCVVEVTDDGAGINAGLVRRRADERGLRSKAELAAMSDEQAVDLVFSAGFSTAAAVSDISGRGIGMNAVRAKVEQVGGRVSLASRKGYGTTVRLDLPMHVALSSIIVVEAGGQRFGVLLDAVAETLRLPSERISRLRHGESFVLRDRVVPICSLARLMHLPETLPPRRAARLFLVTELGNETLALEVDALRDRHEVVLKPMQGLLENAKLYSGTTLLGDGNVLLVLNLEEVLP